MRGWRRRGLLFTAFFKKWAMKRKRAHGQKGKGGKAKKGQDAPDHVKGTAERGQGRGGRGAWD